MAIDTLEIQIHDNAEQAVDGLTKLTSTLTMLKTATSNNAGLGKISRTLTDIATAARGVNGVNLGAFATQMNKISSSLAGLQNLGRNNLTSFITQLNKIPELTSMLSEMETVGGFDSLASGVQKVADAMKPLATEMEKISMGFNAMPKRLQSFITQMDKSATSAYKAASGYKSAANGISLLNSKLNLVALYHGVRRIAGILSTFVDSANQYVEDINLFTVSMGEFADSAYEYAMRAQELMGIDAGQFMRNQGFFQSIASGFGMASDQASILSQNLAQLGYDLASFYNSDVETAMQKLQSGLAGELEPLRRWGFALDQVTLQEVALAHGINMSIREMNQAQKAQIRYIAIMEQSVNAQHDMARTLTTPANAMRIMSQQIELLKRSIGNILIPALSAILPYAIAAAKVLRMVADAIASLFGYTLPTIDYDAFSGMSVGAAAAEDIQDSLGGAAAAAKKMRDYTLGIDELNILRPDDDSGGGGSGGVGDIGGGGFEGLELPQYDFLEGLSSQVDRLIPKVKKLLKVITAVAAALAAIRVVKGVADLLKWFSRLTTAGQFLVQLFGAVLGAVASLGGGFLLGSELARLFAGEIEGFTWKMGLGIAAMVAGTAALTAILGPAGLVLGVLTSLTGVLLGVASAQADMQIATAMNTIFQPNGGVPVQAVADAFFELTDRMNATSEAILTNQTEMNALSDSIDLGSQKVYSLAQANIDTTAQAQQLLPQLAAEYETLSNDIIRNVELAGQTLQNALVLIPQQAYDAAQTTMPGLATTVVSATTQVSEEVLGLQSEFNSLYEQWQSDQSNKDLIVAMQDISARLVETGGAAGVLASDYTSAIDSMVPVDFSSLLVEGDAEATLKNMTTLIDEIAAAGSESQAQLGAAYEELSKSLDVITAGMSPSEAQAIRDTFAEAFKIESNEIITAQNTAIGQIRKGFKSAVNQAAQEADPIWLDHLLAIDHTAEEEATARMKRTFQSVFDALNTADLTSQASKDAVAGFADGLRSGDTAAVTAEAKRLANLVPEGIRTELDMHSPSRVTEGEGKNAVLGFGRGISKNTNLVTKEISVLGTAITKAFAALKTDTAVNAGKSLVQSLGNAITSSASIAVTAAVRVGTDTLQNLSNALGVSGSTSSRAIGFGAALPNGLATGINQGKSTVTAAARGLGSSSLSALQSALSGNSVYNQGINVGNSLANGISASANAPYQAMRSMLNSLLSLVQQFANNFTTGINGTIARAASSMSSVKAAKGAVSYSLSGAAYVPMLATGGLVNSGQMFMAGENGAPEWVGRFGNQTGVLNTEQMEAAMYKAAYQGYSDALRDNSDLFEQDAAPIQIGDETIARANRRGERLLGQQIASMA